MTSLTRNVLLVAHLTLALMLLGCGRGDANRDNASAPLAVTALGRIVPGRSVVSVAGAPGSRLQRLLVKERDRVEASAVLAYLDTYDLRKAELAAARTALTETQARLESELLYANAQIVLSENAARLAQISLDHSRKEFKRAESLHTAQVLSGFSFDDQTFLLRSRELELGKANAALDAAKAEIQRVRSTVGLESAQARVITAEAMLELSIIRAPIAGEVLRIATYPGENVGSRPILQLGDTADMHVIAEVHEMDIRRVKLNQRASVTSRAFEQTLSGTVVELGALIYKNDMLDLDPRANTDTRVVEVRIKLDTPSAVAGFTHLETHVRIDLAGVAASASAPGVRP